jgi:hypothetical protein
VIKRALVFTSLLLCASHTVACTGSHKSITAMRTPCKVREIEISDQVFEPTRETWIASCQGKRYACSTTGSERRVVYACKPIEDASSPPP